MQNDELPKMGGDAVVTIAQLLDMQSVINRSGDTRQGGSSLGKKAGMRALVDLGANTTVLMGDALAAHNYTNVVALGSAPQDPWIDVSNSATLLVPTNILDPDQSTTTWTIATH